MFYFNKICVTGGFGFIGSHFVEAMIKEGKEVLIIDKLTYATEYNFLQDNDHLFVNNPSVSFSKVDIADYEKLTQELNKFKPEAIVNFAAESHVDRSLTEEDVFFDSNVIGVKNILNYIKEHRNILRFIQVSTDEVGGAWEFGSFEETDKRNPRNPYSATKAMAEIMCEAYHANFGLPIIITRGSNTYGPRQYPEKLIPLFIMNLLKDKSVPIYDKGIQVRDWLHVFDHSNGIKYVLENGCDGEIYHIGGNNEKENIEVIDTIFKYLDKPESLKDWTASRKGHDLRYSLDCEKLKVLGWKQTKNWENEIINTIDYYRNKFS